MMQVQKFDEDSYNVTANFDALERIVKAFDMKKLSGDWDDRDEALFKGFINAVNHFKEKSE